MVSLIGFGFSLSDDAIDHTNVWKFREFATEIYEVKGEKVDKWNMIGMDA